MKRIYIILALCLLALTLFAQTTGTIQYIGDKAIVQVWGNHFQRGHAQGYFLGNGILDAFNQYYFPMVTLSDPVYYNYMWNYYQEHFDTDPRMLSEAQGIISGMQDAGVSLYMTPLQRDLAAEDILLVNSVVDMLLVRRAFTNNDLELGCASLSSWGVSTQQDSLLAGSSVITRFLDWSQNSALIAHPVLVVHHPAETDEQPWLSFTFPGYIGALSAINQSHTAAFLNMGNDNAASNYQDLDPICFDVRRGIERVDCNNDGYSDALDLFATIQSGTHLMGTIIHALSENSRSITPVVIENNNSGAVTRYYNQNGNLPGTNLAATNHFRVLDYPTCCTRYSNIQDSLYANGDVSAKRQWNILCGAAGLETNLTAIQYTPSTGSILWSSATTLQPAYQEPAITLSASELFNYTSDIQDDFTPPAQPSFTSYPNPLLSAGTVSLKSSFPFSKCEIYNLRGQKVFSDDFVGRETSAEIELPHLLNGIYLVKLTGADGNSATKKLVICR